MNKNDKQIIACIFIAVFFLVASVFAYDWYDERKCIIDIFNESQEFEATMPQLSEDQIVGMYKPRYYISNGNKIACERRFLANSSCIEIKKENSIQWGRKDDCLEGLYSNNGGKLTFAFLKLRDYLHGEFRLTKNGNMVIILEGHTVFEKE
ncbi:hypothetical protein HZB03_04230 [Candidatus Woesearchaeota archaeon]|nr:hypothetical protein [Candidatus Woesearchaeota archaeon]